MHVRGTCALVLQKRTSIAKLLPIVERLVVVVTAAAASPRPQIVEPRPSPSMAATIERPVRVGDSIGEHVNMWVAGQEEHCVRALVQPRTSRRREEVLVHGTPTGESNPAATSSSWWQGPPLGLSQTPL